MKKLIETLKLVANFCMLFIMFGFPLVLLYKLDKVETKVASFTPIIIYQVDNAGGQLVGTITAKEVIDGHYTVTIGAYGKFLVTKEQYDSLKVGDDAPKYLKQRGS